MHYNFEVNNTPKEIQEFIDNKFTLPYKVVISEYDSEKELHFIHLKWFISDVDLKHLEELNDIWKVFTGMLEALKERYPRKDK